MWFVWTEKLRWIQTLNEMKEKENQKEAEKWEERFAKHTLLSLQLGLLVNFSLLGLKFNF
jgi:hypothetical protein